MGTVPTMATWTAGEKPTAAKLNTNVRDAANFMLNPPRCKLVRAAAQSIPTGATTDVIWDTEVYDTDGMWASGANVTIQTAGLYSIVGNFSLNATGTTNNLSITLRINGSSVEGHRGPFAVSAPTARAVPAEIRLSVGDVVSMGVLHNHASAQSTWTGTNFPTSIAIRWVAV